MAAQELADIFDYYLTHPELGWDEDAGGRPDS